MKNKLIIISIAAIITLISSFTISIIINRIKSQNISTNKNVNNWNSNINDSNNNKSSNEICDGNLKDNLVSDNIHNNDILIFEEKSDNCAEAIEYYYEDDNYKYYFTCIKSPNVFVLINGKKYNIKEALNNNIVTMEELERAGFRPLKESKNLSMY